jgi:hypothetical protein
MTTLKLILCASLLLSVAAPAAAQSSSAAAIALFEEGRAALQRNDFDTACAKFRESNRLDPAIGTAFNLANCEEQRGRLATAWVLFKQVAGRMKEDDPRLAIAHERVTSLDTRVPRVVLQPGPHNSEQTRARLDDMDLDSGSFGSALPLDPGAHRVLIRDPGKPVRNTQFSLAPGETLTFSLEPPSSDATSSTAPREALSGASNERILGLRRADATLAATAIGGAGLLVGTITGIIGLNAQALGNADCSDRTRTCSQDGHDANQRAKTMAVVSSVGLVVGALGAGTATYLFVTAAPSTSATQAAMFALRGTW